MIHFRMPIKNDTRVSACDGYWCAFNSDDWDKVDCPDCLMIRDGVMVLQKFEYGDHEPKETKAFYGHARTEWKQNRYQYTRTVRPDPEPVS